MYSLLKSNPFLLFSQEFQPLQGIAVCDGRLERLPQGVFLVEAKKRCILSPWTRQQAGAGLGAAPSRRMPRRSHLIEMGFLCGNLLNGV